MPQPIDWEAEIEEIRVKATAAARHSERTVGGVSQMLSGQKAQAKALSEAVNRLMEISNRLGSLEAAQTGPHAPLKETHQPRDRKRALPPTLSGLTGLAVGIVASAAYFWS